MTKLTFPIGAAACLVPLVLGGQEAPRPPAVLDTQVVDSVWVANRVSFALRTVGDKQFVAYYDANRMMTVASRTLGNVTWRKTTLPSQLRWDSHNYVAMGIDEHGFVHVSGNMHADPLTYFRSANPYDISEMHEPHRMVGKDERSVTYPRFFSDSQRRLLFSYRSGTCGNGNILVNRFEPEKGRWVRHLPAALFEGKHKGDNRAAYHKYTRDAEGNFHFFWMWRWTPMVETCHQICYAKTPDLINWTNARGEQVLLPFRPDMEAVIIDNTPSKGGMHNSRYQITLAPNGTPIIGYIKYDDNGMTQLYVGRLSNGAWMIRKISDWDFRWRFHGGGDRMSRGGTFRLAGFTPDGLLTVSWTTEKGDRGIYRLDPISLEHVESDSTVPSADPKALRERLSDTPGLSICLQEDSAGPQPDGSRYVLKWEARGKSHGKHAPKVIPDGPLSPLVVVALPPAPPQANSDR